MKNIAKQLPVFLIAFILFLSMNNSMAQVPDALTIDPTGNIGIGTNTPTEKLEVNGRIKDEVGYVMPKGCIVLWSGAQDAIPEGWALCNGTNGTPDLQDRFIVGAGKTYKVNDNGGTANPTLTVAQMPSHNHTASIASGGSHEHNLQRGGGPALGYDWGGDGGTKTLSAGGDHSNPASVRAASAGSHSHGATIASTGGNASFDNRPPYWALCYIIKL